jgi:hypothetical protein
MLRNTSETRLRNQQHVLIMPSSLQSNMILPCRSQSLEWVWTTFT